MTFALDHSPATTVTPRVARVLHAARTWLAKVHNYWFVECVGPSDPFAGLSSRDRADLPTWHPTRPED